MYSRKKRPLIRWSPHHSNYFVVGFNELRMYECTKPTLKRSRNEGHKMVGVNADIRPVRCLDWHPGAGNPFLIATGDNNGRVSLISFRNNHNLRVLGADLDPNSVSKIVEEFSPAQTRPCNDVAWNPLNQNLLAVGLDKIRNANSVLVWDVQAGYTRSDSKGTSVVASSDGVSMSNSHMKGNKSSEDLRRQRERQQHLLTHTHTHTSNLKLENRNAGLSSSKSSHNLTLQGLTVENLDKKQEIKIRKKSRESSLTQVVNPWGEFANSEATVALSWVPDSATSLATGTNFKWLRIYDVRENVSKKQAAPLSVVAHHKGVYGVCFDKHMPSCLATFSEEGIIKIWDIRHLYKPLVEVVSKSKSLLQIGWSPSRPGLLAAITDQKTVSVWDVRSTGAFIEVSEEYGPKQLGNQVVTVSSREKHKDIKKDDSVGDNENRIGEDSNNMEAPTGIVLVKPDRQRYTVKALASFSWKPSNTTFGCMPNLFDTSAEAISITAYKPKQSIHAISDAEKNTNLMLIVSSTGVVDEIMLQDPLPIAVSPAGNVGFACNNLIYESSITEFDPSGLIYTRARLGYSVDPLDNCRLLESLTEWSDKIAQSFDPHRQRGITLEKYSHSHYRSLKKKMDWHANASLGKRSRYGTMKFNSEKEFFAAALGNGISLENIYAQKRNIEEIADMWRWIHRASSLVNSDKAPGLGGAGIISILARRTAVQDETKLDTRLKPGFELYRSRRRSMALQLCGWKTFGQTLDVRTNLQECEDRNELQRAATLAIFNCDLRHAVEILQRASDELRDSIPHNKTNEFNSKIEGGKRKQKGIGSKSKITVEEDTSAVVDDPGPGLGRKYWHAVEEEADLLQLVAMGVAGFPCLVSSQVNQGFQLWCESCIHLQKRLGDFPFLRAALAFLVAVYKRQIYSVSKKSEGTTISKTNPMTGTPIPTPDQISTIQSKSDVPNSDPGKLGGSISSGNNGNSSGNETNSVPLSNEEDLDYEALAVEALNDLSSCITMETSISLADRIAFGCRFLPDTQLGTFIRAECSRAIEKGSLEGIILTGLGSQGMQLLQTYVDQTGDVQTASLAISHTLILQLPSPEYSRVQRWVDAYRSLLNVWQLWHIRGQLDVKFAQRERLRKATTAIDMTPVPEAKSSKTTAGTALEHKVSGSSSTEVGTSNGKQATQSGMISSSSKTNLTDSLVKEEGVKNEQSLMPPLSRSPQMSVACQYCKQTFLSQDMLSGNAMAGGGGGYGYKINLPCCPGCKRRLPSCAVCVLPMNCLNPYAQKKGLSERDRERSRNSPALRLDGKNLQGRSSRERGLSPSALQRCSESGTGKQAYINPRGTGQPFGKWFSWCLRCRHGGHAACLMEWFNGHSRCAVAECRCQCMRGPNRVIAKEQSSQL